MEYSSLFGLDNVLLELLEILKDVDIHPRLIGGYVRDKLLNKAVSDIDIATTLLPTEVMSRLSRERIQAIPTGIKHGTITAIYQNQKFEITTLRKDLKCDGRHAEVAFGKSFIEDALRRDFTINALSYSHIEHRVYDYLEGLVHLKNQQVIFIGKPEDRIKEDALRIMRFFRFSAFYADTIDPGGYLACLELRLLLTSLSKERIHVEFNKLLAAPKASSILKSMQQILGLIFTSFCMVKALDQAIEIANVMKIELTLASRYSALFIETKDFTALKQDLRANCFSRHLINKILKSLAVLDELNKSINKNLKFKAYFVDDHENFEQYLVLAMIAGVITEEVARSLQKDYKTQALPGLLPVTGFELQQLGYQGRAISNGLTILKDNWVQSDFQLTKDELIRIAGRFLLESTD